jgi:hypothetical protein
MSKATPGARRTLLGCPDAGARNAISTSDLDPVLVSLRFASVLFLKRPVAEQGLIL